MAPKASKKQPHEMTYREYRQTDGYKAYAEAKLEEYRKQIQPSIDSLEQFKSSALKERSILFVKPPDPVSKADLYEVMRVMKDTKKQRKEPTALVLNRKMKSLYPPNDPETTYFLANAPKRFQILSILTQAPCGTAEIAGQIDSTVASVRSAVAVLNREIKRDLGLKQKLIDGSAKAGYWINPQYSLKKK